MSLVEEIREMNASQFEPYAKNGQIRFNIDYLNNVISCMICSSYFVDAHTISFCLHTFCKECLKRHFSQNKMTCPRCLCQLPPNPFKHSVVQDTQMQNLCDALICSKVQKHNGNKEKRQLPQRTEPEKVKIDAMPNNFLRFELRPFDAFESKLYRGDLPPLERPFLSVPPDVTIRTLKKFVARKLDFIDSIDRIEMFYKSERLGDEWSVFFIRKMKWEPVEESEDYFINFAVKK